jgi:hypothetical protein
VRLVRVIVPLLTAVVALLVLAPAAAATETATARIRGVEFAATATEGRFAGAASGRVRGAWLATVVHDPLRAGRAVPVTGGSFALHGPQHDVRGTFVGGRVAPRGTPAACGNELFDVTGNVALDGGGRGAVHVVLTHLRVATRSGCRTYGAVVAGSLTVPTRTSAA